MADKREAGVGILAGALGGIAGVFAMNALQLLFDTLHGSIPPRAVRELSQRGGRHDIARLKVKARRSHLPQRDATVRAAERLAQLTSRKNLTPHERHIAGVTVHHAFGVFVGAAYGWAVELEPRIAAGNGLPFGVAVWLIAEEIALPLASLTDTPDKYPLMDHLNALAAHLVFGWNMETVREYMAPAVRLACFPSGETHPEGRRRIKDRTRLKASSDPEETDPQVRRA
jgi:uncharacterized membrane protein YagU involved in acid resistance